MAVESTKMTRNQVHQKLKANFQALCTRCPQLNDRKDSLDDSLTNLQWLWNLNVNISNPVDGGSRSIFSRTNYNRKRNGFYTPNRRQASKSRQNKSVPSYTKSSSNFRSTAPIASNNNQKKFSTISLDQLNSRTTFKPDKNKPYRRKIDFSKNTTPKIERKPVVFVNKTSPKSFDQFEFEEKPDISKISFQTTKNDCYPLLSDAAFYPDPNIENKKQLISPKVEIKRLNSIPGLICKAIKSSATGQLCLESIFKWIKYNNEYYRNTLDLTWQKCVEKTLKQNETFKKVSKKKTNNRKTQWKIAPSTKQPANGKQDDLSNAQNQGIASVSIFSLANRGLSNECVTSSASTALSILNRKRKQTAPQKIVNKNNNLKHSRKNSNSELSSLLEEFSDSNPLKEQAPELGSLKGDFNWTTVFDDFGTDNIMTDAQTNSSCVKSLNSPLLTPNTLNDSATSFFSNALNNLASSGTKIQQKNIKYTTELEKNDNIIPNNENFNLLAEDKSIFTSSFSLENSLPFQNDIDKFIINDSIFHSISDISGNDTTIDGLVPDSRNNSVSIDDFFQGKSGLDLTVQGHQITAPPYWTPVEGHLDSILRENHESNLSPSSNSAISR